MLRFLIFSAVLCAIIAHQATAQIINVENARMQSDTTGWMGNVGLSGSLTKNTEQVLQLQVNTQLQYKTDKDLYLLLGNYGFLSGSSVKLINNAYGHFRYNRKITPALRLEVFTQILQNAITKIDYRFLNGFGPRWKLLGKEKLRLYGASLAMYEIEKELGKPAVMHHNWRSSSYLSLAWEPNDQTDFVSTIFYQPLFNALDDYRLFNQTQFSVAAGKKISLSINFNYLYDNRPAADIPKVNYTLSTGLQFKF